MGLVAINGKFMGANLNSRTYEGKTTTTLLIDIYQSKSPLKDKSVQIKTDDLEKLMLFKEYDEGSDISLICTVSAYKNDPTFRFVDIS